MRYYISEHDLRGERELHNFKCSRKRRITRDEDPKHKTISTKQHVHSE